MMILRSLLSTRQGVQKMGNHPWFMAHSIPESGDESLSGYSAKISLKGKFKVQCFVIFACVSLSGFLTKHNIMAFFSECPQSRAEMSFSVINYWPFPFMLKCVGSLLHVHHLSTQSRCLKLSLWALTLTKVPKTLQMNQLFMFPAAFPWPLMLA